MIKKGRKTLLTNPNKAYKNRTILSTQEIDKMLGKADKITDEYQQKRVKALIGLVKKFGKRRSELARLQINDLIIQNSYLEIKWTISKKHKKGLFQYFAFTKKLIKLGKLPSNYLESLVFRFKTQSKAFYLFILIYVPEG